MLDHPLCDNLRSGVWMVDYIINRALKISKIFAKCRLFADWIQIRLSMVKQLPKSCIPKYFATVLLLAYHALKFRGLSIAPRRLLQNNQNGSSQFFYDALLMTTYQHYGSLISSGLFPKDYPLELSSILDATPSGWKLPSLAAGLPHFSTDFMRCWGRDIFIALPGMLILPGHFQAARMHLIAFASTLRHGLIPNLLDSGTKPRYNARDAVWFWMAAVACYCRNSPEGYQFLGVKVARRFIPKARYMDGPNHGTCNDDDDVDADAYIPLSDKRVYRYSNTIAQLCHEVMERHAMGINFREWNAGHNLDHAMSDRGFDISIKTNWNTGGFITGGNSDNCGTWMDKMGDSRKAGTFSRPATPRDGSPIEITALLKASLKWISQEVPIFGESYWKWKGVSAIKGSIILTVL